MKPVEAALAQKPDSTKRGIVPAYDPYFPPPSLPPETSGPPLATVFDRINSPSFPRVPRAPRD